VNAAIAAVAAAEISVDYLASIGRPIHMNMSNDDYVQVPRWLVTKGVKAWATKVAQTNEALSRVVPYIPQLGCPPAVQS
jgi:hypothetical protein